MKNINIIFLGLLLSIPFIGLAKPFTVIKGQPYMAQGCMHFRIAIYDDNGTPHDTSDDTVLVASANMNTCDDKPKGIDPNLGGSSTSQYHGIVRDQEELTLEDGTTLTVYLVRVIRSDTDEYMVEAAIIEDFE